MHSSEFLAVGYIDLAGVAHWEPGRLPQGVEAMLYIRSAALQDVVSFKTNRERRLERILRAFVALDTGDEPYWWNVVRSAMIVDAKDELNAAPQAPCASTEAPSSDQMPENSRSRVSMPAGSPNTGVTGERASSKDSVQPAVAAPKSGQRA